MVDTHLIIFIMQKKNVFTGTVAAPAAINEADQRALRYIIPRI